MTTEEFEKLTFKALLDYVHPNSTEFDATNPIHEAAFNIVEWECHYSMLIRIFPKEDVELLLDRLSNNEDFPLKDKLDEYKEFLEHSKDEAYWEEHREPREPINLDDYDVDHLPF